jgi:exosortase/archaeosortase family protein
MLMIYVLNVLRIAGLGLLLGYFKSQRNNFTYHHEVFNVLVYICIFVLLYIWIKKNTNPLTEKEKINID